MNINISNPSEPGVYGGVDLYINGLPGFDEKDRVLFYLPAFLKSQKAEVKALFEALDLVQDNYERRELMRNLSTFLFAIADVISDARTEGRPPFTQDLFPDDRQEAWRDLCEMMDRDLQEELFDLMDGMHGIPAPLLTSTAQTVALIILCAKGGIMSAALKSMKRAAEEESLPF